MSVVTGGCLCGAVRYVFDGDVGPANYCHCRDCQRAGGGAFGISVRLPISGFKVVQGTARRYTKHGDSGGELTRHFCGECGSPLFTTSPSHPDVVFVKAGSIDEPELVRPAYQSWLSSKTTWSRIPDDLQSFSKGKE